MAMPTKASMKSSDDAYRLYAKRLFPGGGAAPQSDRVISIRDGVITAISAADSADAGLSDAHYDIIAPGFIDLQINGAGGVLFNDSPDQPGLRQMIAGARQGGTCHLLPTFITAEGDGYLKAMEAVSGFDGPDVLGLHLEGPFLSPEKPGIHPVDAIRKITGADVEALCWFDRRLLLTLAPEEVGANLLSQLHESDIIIFSGHSNSDSETIEKTFKTGLSGITHLFNACSQMTARAPGVVGAALSHHSLFAGIIADGIHVHPTALMLAARAMDGRLFLVTDAMPTYGSDQDGFSLGGRRIELVNGRLQASDGTLAGAHLGLDEAVRNMVTLAGVSLPRALDMASGIPAAVLKLTDSYGLIAAGRPASLTCLTDDLTARAVVVHGHVQQV